MEPNEQVARILGIDAGDSSGGVAHVYPKHESPSQSAAALAADWSQLTVTAAVDPKLNQFQRVLLHTEDRDVSFRFAGNWRASAAHQWTDAFGYSNDLVRYNRYDKRQGGWSTPEIPRLHVLLQYVVWNRDSQGRPYGTLRAQVPLYRNPGDPGLLTLPSISAWSCEALEVLAAAVDDEAARTDNEGSISIARV